MAISFDWNVLIPKESKTGIGWQIWEKKSFNIHRGVIDWNVVESFGSIDRLALKIRAGVADEFQPKWFRGFGFGVILHLHVVPSDASRICEQIDTRSNRRGVWQWVIMCFDEDKRAIGIHTWLHGYLRPVYESALSQLAVQGFECESIDADVDELFITLDRIAKVCKAAKILSGSVG